MVVGLEAETRRAAKAADEPFVDDFDLATSGDQECAHLLSVAEPSSRWMGVRAATQVAWEIPLLKSHVPVNRYPSRVLTALVPGRGGPLVTTVFGSPQISSATALSMRTAFVEKTLFWLIHHPTLASASAKSADDFEEIRMGEFRAAEGFR